MTPAALKILRAAIRVGRRPHSDGLVIVEMLETVLELEGEDPEPAVVEVPPPRAPKTGAERSKAYRQRHAPRDDRHAGRDGARDGVTLERDGNRDDRDVTRDVTGGLGGLDLEIDPEEFKTSDPSRSGSARGGRDDRDVTRDVTKRDAAPRAARDFGMTLDAWLEGMRVATGSSSWVRQALPRGGLDALQATLDAEAPVAGDACSWAKAAAEEYVASNPGQKYSGWSFGDWLRAGRPKREARALAKAPTEPEGNRNPVSRGFELTAEDEARLERAKRNPNRGESEPRLVGGSR